MDIAATLESLFAALSKQSGVPLDELMKKLSDAPEFNKWRIKRVKHSTPDRYWIAAHPAKRLGKVFPQTMPDGTTGYAAASRYVVEQTAITT